MSDRVNEYAGPWKYLYDDYEAGTVFITRDPQESQTPLVAGLTIEQAAPIVAALNVALATERATAAVDSPNPITYSNFNAGVNVPFHEERATAVDVERLTEAYDNLGGMYSWNDEYIDNPANQHLWTVRAARILRELVGRSARNPNAAARLSGAHVARLSGESE